MIRLTNHALVKFIVRPIANAAAPLLLTFVVLAGSGHSAQPATILLNGANYDVYYDDSYWQGVALSGNTLSLTTALAFTGAPGLSNMTEFASALTLVPHSGLAFTGAATVGVRGTYSLPGYLNGPYGPDGGAGIQAGAMVFVGPAFSDYLGYLNAASFAAATPLASSGLFAPAGATDTSIVAAQYGTLRLNPILDLFASPRLTAVTLDGASFSFETVTASAVPAPPGWLLLLGGLALLGSRLRRRRAAAWCASGATGQGLCQDQFPRQRRA